MSDTDMRDQRATHPSQPGNIGARARKPPRSSPRQSTRRTQRRDVERKREISYAHIGRYVRYADEDLLGLAASILSAARKFRQPLAEAQAEGRSPTAE